MFGLIREVSLKRDHSVAPWIACSRGNGTAESVQRPVISDMLPSTEDGERHDVGIRPQGLRRRVGASVVEHENLVFARVFLEDLTNAPEQDADCFSFVKCGDADVQHQSLERAAVGRVSEGS